MDGAGEDHETEPLRREGTVGDGDLDDGSLRVLDMEKHVLDPTNPREIVRFPGQVLLDQRNLIIIAVVALLSSFTLLVCWAVLSDTSSPRAVGSTVREQGPAAYDFVGEGNCKPNRPQWARKVRYKVCRATCDSAAACIGFDWDARWTFCRVRFVTNHAIQQPPRGWEAIPGTEGGRLSRQAAKQPVGGIISGIEGSHTAGCFQKAVSVPFHRFLSQPSFDGFGHAMVGPLPNILEYYWETGLMAPLQASSRHLQAKEHGLLACNASMEELVLPSLDATPLLRVLQVERMDKITIVVGLNSDSMSFGLGLAIEASPQINETEDDVHQEHQWYGGRRNRNVVMFFPSVADGLLSISGPGGFGDTPLGFTPHGWTGSGRRLHLLELTAGVDGANEVVVRDAGGRHSWRGSWRHKLFDGKDVPSLYAFIDSGGEPGKPLFLGRASLRAKEVWT